MSRPTEKQTNVRAVGPKATSPMAGAKNASPEPAVLPETCHGCLWLSRIFGKHVLCLGKGPDFIILSGGEELEG